jgi:hypothetical protein
MMAKRILVGLVLAVGCLAQIGLALPDLVVAQLEITPAAPTDSTLVTLIAVVENVGHDDASSSFFVRFTVDDQEIDLVSLASLRRGRTERLTATWPATAGPHVLSVEIDEPFNRIRESDELNNTRSLHVDVRLNDEMMAILGPLKIAVARFDDVSGTGFVNVGQGVADELIDRLATSGLRVLDRVELDAVMQANGLNPALPSDVALASQLIGADLLVLGSVVGVDVREASLSLGFLRFDSASVDVSLSAQVVDVYASHTLSFVSAEGRHEGTTGFSIDLGQLLSFLSTRPSEICSDGLLADHARYNSGQTVLLGYRNDGAPGWFGVEIYSSTGAFLKWLGWQFVDTGECETWFWDQRNASGVAVSPGIYTTKLWDGTSYVDTAGLQIRPGIGLSIPAADEITVGSQQFDKTVVGTATSRAIGQLASALLLSLQDAAPQVLDREAPLAAARMMIAPREAQIAAILPDGRIAVNLGASSGVTEGDVFEVLEVENLVHDPQTSEILAYDVVSVKGEIRITEAHERVSYAVLIDDFVPAIGDIVRGVP